MTGTMKKLLSLLCLLFGGCTGIPDGLVPVESFQLERYLGTWYEVARLDHSFERGLSRVTADYSLRDDGRVKVVNRGYDEKSGEWKSAEGVAAFVGSSDVAHLKVSFFGPFYGAYVVFALDRENYQYAMVCGPSRDYLWLLSRRPQLDEGMKKKLVARAEAFGFGVDGLIFVTHD